MTLLSGVLRCPFCEAATHLAEPTSAAAPRPEPGAVSVCERCVRVSVYDLEGATLVLRRPSPAEQVVIGMSPEVAAAQAALRLHLGSAGVTAAFLRDGGSS